MILKFPDGKRIDFKYASTVEIIAEAGAAPAFMFSLLEPPQMYETVGGGQGIGPVEGLMAALSLQAPTAHKKGSVDCICLKKYYKVIAKLVNITALIGTESLHSAMITYPLLGIALFTA